MWCGYCGSKDHTIDNCPKTWGGQANRNAMRCGYCGSTNHNRPACPKTVAEHNRKPSDYVKDR